MRIAHAILIKFRVEINEISYAFEGYVALLGILYKAVFIIFNNEDLLPNTLSRSGYWLPRR